MLFLFRFSLFLDLLFWTKIEKRRELFSCTYSFLIGPQQMSVAQPAAAAAEVAPNPYSPRSTKYEGRLKGQLLGPQKQAPINPSGREPESYRHGSPRGSIRMLKHQGVPEVPVAPASYSCVYTNKGRGEFRLRRSVNHYDSDTNRRVPVLTSQSELAAERSVATPNTKAHRVATQQWQSKKLADSTTRSLSNSRSRRGLAGGGSSASGVSPRGERRGYDPVEYRTARAVREGRAVEDADYYDARLAIRETVKQRDLQVRLRRASVGSGADGWAGH